MKIDHNSQFQVAACDIPYKTRQAVIENRTSDELADVKSFNETLSQIEVIRADQTEKLRSLLGDEKYAELRAYIAAEKREKARALLPPHGPQMSREDLQKLQAHKYEKSLLFLHKLGVELSDLKALNKVNSNAQNQLIPPAPERDGKPVGLIPPNEVPEEIRHDSKVAIAPATAAWTAYRPPFPGWAWSYSWSSSGFGINFDRFLDTAAGLVGSWTYLTDGDASDGDVAWLGYNSSIGFWYQMPSAGLLDVWIEVQPALDRHYLSLSDEWGWSDSSVAQRNYLTLKGTAGTASSGISLAEMSWFTESGYTDGYWDVQYLTSGSTYWAHLYSDIAFAAGQWVYVEVGNRNWNYCFANDVSEYSFTDFRWYIKSVWVRPS
ncbi:MAG: hypothetical protein Kow00121_01480 [Elainellaceae cyanobacterium]